MLLTVYVVISLLIGLYQGARRGLVLQLLMIVGYGVSFYFAKAYFEKLAQWTQMIIPFPSATENTQLTFYSASQTLGIDEAFYKAISFMGIFILGVIVTRILAYWLREVRFLPILAKSNEILGAIFGLLSNYLGVFLTLNILSLLPMDSIQQQFVDSQLAYFIVSRTPILSDVLTKWWF